MTGMTKAERRATSALASLFALRMLGLFMIIPVFALYGGGLDGATPALIGLAIGVYGLAQAVLQIPMGMLADRFDRKRLIFLGLVLFAAGGAVAAVSTSIWGVIAGRAIQGAGAISAVVMALLADLTREENRTKAMASIGLSIGLSFAVAFIVGPLVAGYFGLAGLFWATSLLAVTGMGLLLTVPYSAVAIPQNPEGWHLQLLKVLRHAELIRLNAGIFILHLVMTACFVLVPHLLRDNAGIPAAHHGWVYLPVVLGGFVLAVPAIIVAEKKRRIKEVFAAGIVLLAMGLAVMAVEYRSFYGLVAGLVLFFIAFNLQEALLPSLLSKMAPVGSKATAMGVYSSAQFLGAFCGGVAGGLLWREIDAGHIGYTGACLALALLALVWLGVALGMRQPRFLHSMTLSVPDCSTEEGRAMAQRLLSVPGVEEAVVIAGQRLAYLKVDRERLNTGLLRDLIPGAVAV
jgi:predicted MFS family arabinose efflux permease